MVKNRKDCKNNIVINNFHIYDVLNISSRINSMFNSLQCIVECIEEYKSIIQTKD